MSYRVMWLVYVPEEHLETFRQVWREAIPVYEELGTRDPVFLMPVDVTTRKYGVGALGDVLKPPADGEVLLVGFDTFDSREACDATMAAYMADERSAALGARCVPLFGADFTRSFFRGEYTLFE